MQMFVFLKMIELLVYLWILSTFFSWLRDQVEFIFRLVNLLYATISPHPRQRIQELWRGETLFSLPPSEALPVTALQPVHLSHIMSLNELCFLLC